MWEVLEVDIRVAMGSSSGRMGRIIVAITPRGSGMAMASSTIRKIKPVAEAYGRMARLRGRASI